MDGSKYQNQSEAPANGGLAVELSLETWRLPPTKIPSACASGQYSVAWGELNTRTRQGYPRNKRRLILPLVVLGNSATNSTMRGYL